MAVSFNDAWNDAFFVSAPNPVKHEIERTPVDNNSDFVSAKKTKDVAEDKLYKEMKLTFNEHNKLIESLVNHIAELRKEEAKRSSIYIALGAILFALLFMYMDKLQNKIKNLTYSIPHHSMNPIEHSRPAIYTEPVQWYK